jgi:hypothetical protein
MKLSSIFIILGAASAALSVAIPAPISDVVTDLNVFERAVKNLSCQEKDAGSAWEKLPLANFQSEAKKHIQTWCRASGNAAKDLKKSDVPKGVSGNYSIGDHCFFVQRKLKPGYPDATFGADQCVQRLNELLNASVCPFGGSSMDDRGIIVL